MKESHRERIWIRQIIIQLLEDEVRLGVGIMTVNAGFLDERLDIFFERLGRHWHCIQRHEEPNGEPVHKGVRWLLSRT